jgi:acyl-coenzyme A synthetase/AMP-(fatty) acid ligase
VVQSDADQWGIYRQTETGSIVVTPFPGAVETKPGAATVPFFGIEPALLEPTTGKVRTAFISEGGGG